MALSGASGAYVSDDRRGVRASRTRSRLAIALELQRRWSSPRSCPFTIPNLAPPIGVAAAAATWLHRRLARDLQTRALAIVGRDDTARYGLVAAIGAACGLDVSDGDWKAPALEAALARLGPHPTLAGITEVTGFGHPTAAWRTGADLGPARVPSLFITRPSADIVDEHPGDAALLRQRLQPYADRDKAMLIEDIERQRPDARCWWVR